MENETNVRLGASGRLAAVGSSIDADRERTTSDAPTLLVPPRTSVQAANEHHDPQDSARIRISGPSISPPTGTMQRPFALDSQPMGHLGFLQDVNPLQFVEDLRPLTVGLDLGYLTNRLDQQQQLIERWVLHWDAQQRTTMQQLLEKESALAQLRQELDALKKSTDKVKAGAGETAAETQDLDSTGKSIEEMIRYNGNANGLVEPYEGKDIINTFFGGHTQASPTAHLLLSQKQMDTLFKRIFPAFRFQKRRALEMREIGAITDREFLSQMKRQTILMNNRHAL